MLTCLLLLGGALALQARQYGIEIKVEGADAPSRTLFSLDEQPQVSYNENQELLLTLGDEVEFVLPSTAGMQVSFVELSNNPTGIESPDVTTPAYAYSNGQFSLSGLKPGTQVRVLNVQGQPVTTMPIGTDGQAVLPLPQGVSIVTVNGWSMKVNMK